jgi:hypothetical protein
MNSPFIAKRYVQESTKVDLSPKAILVSRGFNRRADRFVHPMFAGALHARLPE